MSSSSGSTPLPGATPPSAPAAGGENAPKTVQLAAVPPDLRDIPERTRVQGEVREMRDDGTFRVRTDRGDVEVRYSRAERQAPVRKGDRVTLDIPPGNPPRNARIETQNTQPQTDTPVPPRSSETPVNVQVSRPDAPPPAPPPATALLPGQTVRAETLTPQQVLQMIADPVQTALKLTTLPIQLKAEAIAQSATVLPPLPTETVAAPPAQLQAPVQQTAATPAILPAEQPAQTTAAPGGAPPLITSPLTAQGEQAQTQIPALPLPETPGASVNLLKVKPAALLTLEPITTIPGKAPAPGNISAAQPFPAVQITRIETAAALFQSIKPAAEPALVTPALSPAPQTPAAESAAPSPLQTLLGRLTGLPPAEFKNLPAPDALPQKLSDLPALADLKTPITAHRSASEIPARIVAHTLQNLPVAGFFSPALQDFSFLALHAPAVQLPIGAQLSLAPAPANALTGALAPHGLAAGTPAPAPLYFLTPGPWPMMQDVAAALSAAAPQAMQALANVTPSPANPANLGPAALLFIAAARSGDLTQWLGERALDTLRRVGRGGTISRIGQESNALSRLSNEPVSQDWRALSLPLQWQGEYQKIALYYRHDDSGSESDDKKGRGTRFVFDLALNRMGPVQLDGLFIGNRLDLIVRTETRFTEAAKMEMRKLYADALRETQISGELNFQSETSQWVKITPTNAQLGLAI